MGTLNQKLSKQQVPVDSTVFDTVHFDRQTFGETALQQEILQLFLTQLDDTRRALAKPGSSAGWRYLTHTLRGAAAAIGATGLTVLVDNWEQMEVPTDAERHVVLAAFDAAVGRFKTEASKLAL